MNNELPVAQVLGEILSASRTGAAIVTAPPGSGKTTLVPPALVDDLPSDSRVFLVQPRRLAARAVARRIAQLRNVEVGGEVGYQVRFDSRISRDTRLIVATPGILLRRMIDDIALEGVAAVVLDEFHERSIEMDLLLGMLQRIHQTLRPDLRRVVMSATLDAEPVSRYLGACPIIHAEGRPYPVQIRYQRRGEQQSLTELVTRYVAEAVRETAGHALVFLPGVGEIMRCQEALAPWADREGLALLPLFGDLPPDQQDRVLGDLGRRKIILATNVAETSITIDGVTAVVDSGQARQMQVAPATGLPRLELVPISIASADQRAGRAGRTAPGVCWRLWDEASHRLRPDVEKPEVLRTDMAGPLLQLLALGEQGDFPWLNAPPDSAIENARRLLTMLGALNSDEQLTPLGSELARLPAHPRLGRLLLAGANHGVLRESSIAAALLSERDPFRAAEHSRSGPRQYGIVRSRSDIVDRVFALQAFHEGESRPDPTLNLHPGGAKAVLRAAEQLYHLSDFKMNARAADPAQSLMRALLEAYPDRLARLRPGTQDRALMVGGRGVRIDTNSRVRGESLFLAIDLNDTSGEARARMVSAVDRSWLGQENLVTREEMFFNPTKSQVEARQRTYWQDLLLEETPTSISNISEAADILAQHARQQLERVLPAPDSTAMQFRSRIRWLAETLPELHFPCFSDENLAALLPQLCLGLRSLDDLRNADWLPILQAPVGYDRLSEVDRLAPSHIEVPSGNRIAIVYEPGKVPVLAVRIQELFGLTKTPTIAGGRVPLLLHLLGPNYRPQQVTSDLASFWANAYPEVKKELQRRYPKHAWPDDPLTAQPTRSGLKRDSQRG